MFVRDGGVGSWQECVFFCAVAEDCMVISPESGAECGADSLSQSVKVK